MTGDFSKWPEALPVPPPGCACPQRLCSSLLPGVRASICEKHLLTSLTEPSMCARKLSASQRAAPGLARHLPGPRLQMKQNSGTSGWVVEAKRVVGPVASGPGRSPCLPGVKEGLQQRCWREGVGWRGGDRGDSFCVRPGMPGTQAPGLVYLTTQATPGPPGMGSSAVEPRDAPDFLQWPRHCCVTQGQALRRATSCWVQRFESQ